ncbi:MAG: NUDIX hydrolase [Anaerolineae bacterium]|nr:NUDIX hydrolase [Anaerolineae bacterium]
MEFEILSTRDLFSGRVFNVRRDHLRYPDGRETDYDIIVHPGAVAIIPIDAQEQVWFVRQYRHAAGKYLLELPAGTLDDGEDPQTCAAREIREEIGYAASEFKQLGSFFLAPGYSDEFMHVFIATGLSPDPLPADEDEFLQPVCHPLSEVWSLLDNGKFEDAKTIASLCLARSSISSRD